MGLREFGVVIIQNPDDLRSVAFYKALVVEFLSTLLFLFFTLGNVFNNCSADWDLSPKFPSGAQVEGECQTTSARVLSISFSFGVAIFVLVYAAASFSGGHLNPAVSVGLMLGKRISVVRAFCYIIVQLGGATIGAGFAKAINKEGFHLAGGAVNKLNRNYTYGAGWTMEAILTFALVFMVYSATDTLRGSSTAHIPVLAPLSIGMVVFLSHLVAIPIDNCSINPARSFGAAVWADTWTGHWLFWIGPLSGAVIAAVVYELILNIRPEKAEAAIAKTTMDGAAKLEPYPGTEGLGQHTDATPKGQKARDEEEGNGRPDTAREHHG